MSRPPHPADPAWLAFALFSLRACCADMDRAVTKHEFSVWSHAHPPFCGPERMVKRGGKSWLVWLEEAGYAPSQAQRNAAGRPSSGSRAARREREAKQPRSAKPCLNDRTHERPLKGNRYCTRCHKWQEGINGDGA